MHVTVITPQELLYEGAAQSVFLRGDQGEFELMDHHAPLISLLTRGDVVIDWDRHIPINRGIARIDNDECVIIVEE